MEVKFGISFGFKTTHASREYGCALVRAFRNFANTSLELGVPVWQPGLAQQEIKQIERFLKCALHIILGECVKTYKQEEQKFVKNLQERQSGTQDIIVIVFN